VTLNINDSQHSNAYLALAWSIIMLSARFFYCYADSCYPECHFLECCCAM